MRAAVIGSGIAGLTCAQKLTEQDWDVTVFDKGRGPGGRISTRRADGLAFDHGGQFFTALGPRLREQVQRWRDAGVVAPWDGRIVRLTRGEVEAPRSVVERFVGVPGMGSIARHMAEGLNVVQEARVTKLERTGEDWTLSFADVGEQSFPLVVVAVPAPQALDLLSGVKSLARRIESVRMAPCLAAMVAFDKPIPLEFDAAFVGESCLAWIARNGSKPGRGDGECWVLHASVQCSDQHLEKDPAESGEILLSDFAAATAATIPKPSLLLAHRWRYAKTRIPLGEGCLFDPDLRVGACGDWCLGERIEDAYLSGLAMAEAALGS